MSTLLVLLLVVGASGPESDCDSFAACVELVDQLEADTLRLRIRLDTGLLLERELATSQAWRMLSLSNWKETPLARQIEFGASTDPSIAACALAKLGAVWHQRGELFLGLRDLERERAPHDRENYRTDCSPDFGLLLEAAIKVSALAFETAVRYDVFGPCRDDAYAFLCEYTGGGCPPRIDRNFMLAEVFESDLRIRTGIAPPHKL